MLVLNFEDCDGGDNLLQGSDFREIIGQLLVGLALLAHG